MYIDHDNYDIRPSVDDIVLLYIMGYQEVNEVDFDPQFDPEFRGIDDDDDDEDDDDDDDDDDNNDDNNGDITDYEDDDTESEEEEEEEEEDYMLLNPSPIIKPKKKRLEVKFTHMTSAEIRDVHEEYDKKQQEKLERRKTKLMLGESMSFSETKPLRIEFAIIDDEDEKIILQSEDMDYESSIKHTNNLNNFDEEKINIEDFKIKKANMKEDKVIEVNTNNVNNDESMTTSLLSKDEKNGLKVKKQNESSKNKTKQSRLEREMNENNGICNFGNNSIFRFFCI